MGHLQKAQKTRENSQKTKRPRAKRKRMQRRKRMQTKSKKFQRRKRKKKEKTVAPHPTKETKKAKGKRTEGIQSCNFRISIEKEEYGHY